MSGADLMIVVKRRLEISHHIKIELDEKETDEVDKELEKEAGKELECHEILTRIAKMSDDELYEMVQKIRKKKKKEIAGVT